MIHNSLFSSLEDKHIRFFKKLSNIFTTPKCENNCAAKFRIYVSWLFQKYQVRLLFVDGDKNEKNAVQNIARGNSQIKNHQKCNEQKIRNKNKNKTFLLTLNAELISRVRYLLVLCILEIIKEMLSCS